MAVVCQQLLDLTTLPKLTLRTVRAPRVCPVEARRPSLSHEYKRIYTHMHAHIHTHARTFAFPAYSVCLACLGRVQIIQTAKLYPANVSFLVRTVLPRLIARSVWAESRQLWDGFVHACATMSPASLPVLLQLPRAQLEAALAMPAAAGLRAPLLRYLTQEMAPAQRGRWRHVVALLAGPGDAAAVNPAGAPGDAPLVSVRPLPLPAQPDPVPTTAIAQSNAPLDAA
jgi:hypothetical protein